MRFTLALTAAVATVAAAEEGGFAQYKAQFQNFLGKFGAIVPTSVVPKEPIVSVAAAKIGALKVNTLTLDSWKDTLYEPVKAAATIPEEWYVFISGRNKTCFGHCDKAEKAFNASATKFATMSKRPHLAIVNCDDEPVLCNSWSATTGNIWAFQMLPSPAPIDIYSTRLNLTTVTADDVVKKYTNGKKDFKLVESFFHPFNGKAAELGIAVPIGYVFWAFGLVPQWAFMIVVSLLSRTMMGNRMQDQQRRATAPAPAAAQ